MIGLDTNVLLRAVTRDDPVRTPIARDLIGSLSSRKPGHVNCVVLAEFAWTLRSRYRYARLQIVAAIEAMAASAAFVLERRAEVNSALVRCRDDGLHFADALIGELNRAAGCEMTMTFDTDLLAAAGFSPPAEHSS